MNEIAAGGGGGQPATAGRGGTSGRDRDTGRQGIGECGRPLSADCWLGLVSTNANALFVRVRIVDGESDI